MTAAEHPELLPILHEYRLARQKVYEQLDGLRAEVDRWLASHETTAPSITGIAGLEYLLHRRRQLLDDITALEDGLIRDLLESRRSGSASE